MDRVKLALENATYTKDLVIGQGVLPKVAVVFKEQFPGKRAFPASGTAEDDDLFLSRNNRLVFACIA